MCSIICNNGECKYCSPTWYCILESIELNEDAVCTCYEEWSDTELPSEEEIEAALKLKEGELEL